MLNLTQEVPHPQVAGVGATGHFTATLTGTTLKWRLAFARLSGPPTGAQVHFGAKGKTGRALMILCGACRSPRAGTRKVTRAEITDMRAGKTYVNVDTATNRRGEIRGQIKHVS